MRNRILFSTVFCIFLFFVTLPLLAAERSNPVEPRLEPRNDVSFYTETYNPDDWQYLFSLAYWVSGASDDIQAVLNSFIPVIDELSVEVSSMDERTKAETVLSFMHQRFLTFYSVNQTRLDTLLSSGRYNCVSSAILYTILGTAAGLEVAGVGTADHAFCSVRVGEETIDVETTNLYGFDPGSRTDFHDAFGKTTGYIYVPPRKYSERRNLDLLNLFSLVLSNRIVDAESSGNYSEAVGLAVDRWALLGEEKGPAFEELIDRMVNYGAALAGKKQEEAALDWAKSAIAVYGPHPKWDAFLDSVVNNLIVKLIRAGKIVDARSQFEHLKLNLTVVTARTLDIAVSEAELIAALNEAGNTGDDSVFYSMLKSASEVGIVHPERLHEFEENWRLNKINNIARAQGWEAAFKAAEEAILEMGSSPKLENARRIARSNHIAELYNEAVSAFNAGRYSEARRLTESAIDDFPDEKKFSSLLKNMERTPGFN